MRLHRISMFMAVVVLLLAVFGCATRENPIAQVGRKYSISERDFRKYVFQDANLPPEYQIGRDELKRILEGMVDDKVLLAAAYQTKLDRDSVVLARHKPVVDNIRLQTLFERLNIDPFIKETDIRDFYSRMGRDVVIRTIFFKVSLMGGPDEEANAKKKAMEVLQRLKAGESFSELATRFSDDKTTSNNGGLVGTLSWDRSDDPVRRAAFSLKEGQYSGIIRNSLGINIVYVEEIQEKKREPLESVRDQIRSRLAEERWDLITKRKQENEAKIAEQTRIRWEESSLDTLASWFKASNARSRDGFLSVLNRLPEADQRMGLAQSRLGELPVLGVKRLIEERIPQTYENDLGDKNNLKELLEYWLVTDMLLEMARKKGLDRDAAVKKRTRDALEKIMVDYLNEREILGKIDPTPENERAFFEREKEKRYSDPESIKIQEIMVGDRGTAEQIVQWAREGRDFGAIAEANTLREGYRPLQGIFPSYLAKGTGGVLGEAGFRLQVGQVSGPIPMGEGRFSVIKLLDRKPSVVKPYESVANAVSDDYFEAKRQEMRQALLDQKKKEFGVHINEDLLARFPTTRP